MAVMDIILAFPIFLLAIVIMVILEPSTTNVVIALGIVRIPIYARVVRSSVLSVKENEYIEAVRALALGRWRVFHHVLPNCMAPIIITSTLSVSTSILIESSLSFLGLGTQPPTPSWVGMGSESQSGVYRYQSVDCRVPGGGHFSDHAGLQYVGGWLT